MSKTTTKILAIITSTISIIIVLAILGYIFTKWSKPLVNKEPKEDGPEWQYKLIYKENDMAEYTIYKLSDNKVILDANTQPNCIKEPCERQIDKIDINFNEYYMRIVDNFINSFFKNQNYKERSIVKEDVPEKKLNVLYSIIYNDETYLEESIHLLKEDKYIITTDEKFKTMLNDGGSYIGINYEIDLKNNEVTKIEETYYANLGGTPKMQKNNLYVKKIDYYLYEETNEVIGMALEKDDDNEEGNYYYYYKVESATENKEIYNLNTIDKIKELLTKYDEFDISTSHNKKLLFKLQSTLIKCPTRVLYVYDDNTYEFYSNSITSDKEAKSGIYAYDIDNLLNEVGYCVVDGYGTYKMIDSENKEQSLGNCQVLEDFIKSLNIDIHECIGREE